MTTVYEATLEVAELRGQSHPQTRVVRHGLEDLRQVSDAFAQLRNFRLFHSAQFLDMAQDEVADLVGIEAHQPAAGCIDRTEIMAHDKRPKGLGRAVERAVALHADDAVDDG